MVIVNIYNNQKKYHYSYFIKGELETKKMRLAQVPRQDVRLGIQNHILFNFLTVTS